MRPCHISRLQWRALLEGSWSAPTFIHPGNVVNIKIADKWWMDVHPNMALWLLTHTHSHLPFILPTFEPPEVERVPRMALLKREGRACGACGQHRQQRWWCSGLLQPLRVGWRCIGKLNMIKYVDLIMIKLGAIFDAFHRGRSGSDFEMGWNFQLFACRFVATSRYKSWVATLPTISEEIQIIT